MSPVLGLVNIFSPYCGHRETTYQILEYKENEMLKKRKGHQRLVREKGNSVFAAVHSEGSNRAIIMLIHVSSPRPG